MPKGSLNQSELSLSTITSAPFRARWTLASPRSGTVKDRTGGLGSSAGITYRVRCPVSYTSCSASLLFSSKPRTPP